MAWTVEAYYQQRTNNDVLDRIEIQQDGGAGRNLELEANSQGFRYRMSEITSESDDGLINPLANKIQVGKLTFFPKIESTAEETLLDDILGSPDNSFRIVWKQDGSVTWTGYIDNKKRSYPETGGLKFTEIRASDFELLKTIDYTLDDTRQTLITTIADLLGNLSFGYNIRTATSWITQNTTSSTDFLSQIYHETKALREFARTGDESDQPISVWDALVSVGDPALLFRQVNGEFTVEQLTAFSDPSAVSETVYTSAGVVSTATTSVDRRLTGFTSTDSGSLVVKNGSQNDIYPGIKRAKVVFDHRTQVSGIELPSDIELVDAGTESFTQLFIGDGTQDISLSFDVYAETNISQSSMDARFRILIDTYYLQDDGSWSTTTNSYYEVSLTKGKPLVGGGNVWRGSFSILTDDIPDAADGTLTLQFAGATGDVDFANDTLYTAMSFKINNPVASENSTTIHYQLTQSDGYSTNFTLNNTWFGDGPTGYSVSALRYGTGDGQVTADTWQRRGSVAYRSFHENLLKEILDLQRTNTRKLNAEFWGQYDPSKILVYDSQNFYCAGVSYTGVLGRWSANLFRVNVQTGTDTFEDIPKFTDETGSGSGTATTGGGGGGVDVTTGDARWLNESENLADLDSVPTALSNLGLSPTDDVTFNSATLSALTSGRVVFAGASGLLQDSSNLTFDGTNLALASATFGANNALTGTLGDARYGQLGASNTWTASNAFNAGLTATTGLFTGAVEMQSTLAVGRATPEFAQVAEFRGDESLLGGVSAIAAFYHVPSGTATDGIGARIDIGTKNDAGSLRAGRIVYMLNDVSASSEDAHMQFHTHSAGSFGNRFQIEGQDGRFFHNLYVEGGLFAKEFIVDQTRVMYNFSMSPEGGKISTVTGSAGSEVITFEDEDGTEFIPVSVGSILRVQERTGLASGTIVKSLWRVVASITGNNITLSTTGITWTTGNDVGSIEVGDYAVQRGHTTDATLDGRIDFQVSGVDMPYISVWDGSDDVNGGFEALRVGGMSGFSGSITGDVGIAGATSGDGAVFWITEDEAKIGGFGIGTNRISKLGNSDLYIGDNISAIDAEKTFGIGFWRLQTDTEPLPIWRIRASDTAGGVNVIQAKYNGDADWGLEFYKDGDRTVAFGDDNYISELDITGDLTAIDGGRVIGRNTSDDLVFSLSPSGVTFWNSSGAQVFSANSDANEVRIAQRLRLDLDTATSASTGSASALPANPETYISVDVNDGGTVKTLWIPAYDSAGSPPSAPTSVSLCQAASALRVSWGTVSGATGYIVERSTASTGPWSQVADVSTTSYDDPFPPFNPDVTYFYRVFAYNANGSSGASSTVSDSYNGATAC